jgi:hypothetical protein
MWHDSICASTDAVLFSVGLAPAESASDEDGHGDQCVGTKSGDIDVFSSLNYLGPPSPTMDAWLQCTGRAAWAEELAVVVAEPHRLTPYRGRHTHQPGPSAGRTSTM